MIRFLRSLFFLLCALEADGVYADESKKPPETKVVSPTTSAPHSEIKDVPLVPVTTKNTDDKPLVPPAMSKVEPSDGATASATTTTEVKHPTQNSIKDGAALVGTWTFESYMRVQEDGKESPWCKNPYGFIVYSPEGYMSTAVNCDRSELGNKKVPDAEHMLFYTGTYTVQEEGKVTQHVLNSSDLSLIGKDLMREVRFQEDGKLVLSGRSIMIPTGNFKVILKKLK